MALSLYLSTLRLRAYATAQAQAYVAVIRNSPSPKPSVRGPRRALGAPCRGGHSARPAHAVSAHAALGRGRRMEDGGPRTHPERIMSMSHKTDDSLSDADCCRLRRRRALSTGGRSAL